MVCVAKGDERSYEPDQTQTGQALQSPIKTIHTFLTLDDGTDRLSRNVSF